MRIGVVGDSHGNLYMLDKAIASMGKLDMIIHLGDDYRDIIRINEKYNLTIHYVVGNNDYSPEPVYEKTITAEGKRIFICHGHRYDVYNGIERLYFKGLEEKADIVLYGHTHRQRVDRNGEMIFLNPGSLSNPRDGKEGYAVIDINDDKKIEVKVLRLTE